MFTLIRPELWCGLPDASAELVMLWTNSLNETIFLWNALDMVLDVVRELVKQSYNVGKRIVGRFGRELAKLFHRVVQLRVDLTLNIWQSMNSLSVTAFVALQIAETIPLRDEIRQQLTQPDHQVLRSQVFLVDCVELGPMSSARKVLGFPLARLFPGNVSPEFLCTWLLDAEPVVIEWTILVLD